jgi:hypothetical protein
MAMSDEEVEKIFLIKQEQLQEKAENDEVHPYQPES